MHMVVYGALIRSRNMPQSADYVRALMRRRPRSGLTPALTGTALAVRTNEDSRLFINSD
jgi:hypothetical protein